jgi:pimeloyl-ACP methyl ester carboxylesterase
MTLTHLRRRLRRPSPQLTALVIGLVGLIALTVPVPAPSASAQAGGPKPTVVLVHGAWADASGWSGVIRRLQDDGCTVAAIPNQMHLLLQRRPPGADLRPEVGDAGHRVGREGSRVAGTPERTNPS